MLQWRRKHLAKNTPCKEQDLLWGISSMIQSLQFCVKKTVSKNLFGKLSSPCFHVKEKRKGKKDVSYYPVFSLLVLLLGKCTFLFSFLFKLSNFLCRKMYLPFVLKSFFFFFQTFRFDLPASLKLKWCFFVCVFHLICCSV